MKTQETYEFFGISIIKDESDEERNEVKFEKFERMSGKKESPQISGSKESKDYSKPSRSFIFHISSGNTDVNFQRNNIETATFKKEKNDEVSEKQEKEPSVTKTRKLLNPKWMVFKNTIVLSFGFILLFSSFNAVANIQSSVNKIVGITALWVIYASFFLSCLFIPSILMSKLSIKWTIPLCMISYSAYIAAQFRPSYYTLIPTAFMVGMSAAPLWSAKSSYLTQIASYYAEKSKRRQEIIVTQLFGIFFLFYHLSKIIGNLILSTLLPAPSVEFSNVTYSFCGANFCPSNLQHLPSGKEEQDSEKIFLVISILLGLSAVSILIIVLFLDPLSKHGINKVNDANITSLIFATFKQLKRKNQLLLIPLTFYSGLQKAFVSSDFTAAFITCSTGIQLIGILLLVFGVFESVASALMGFFVKLAGRISLFTSATVINMIILLMLYFWEPQFSAIVLYVIVATWGLCDAVWQIQINALYGTLFPEISSAAFSCYNLFKSFGYMVAYIFSTTLCVDAKIYILFGVLIFSIGSYYLLERSERNKSDLMFNELYMLRKQ